MEQKRRDGEEGEGREKRSFAQGCEAITKLQKLTIKPDRHTGATIKLKPDGRPIGAYFWRLRPITWPCRRTPCIYFRVRVSPARGWILPRKENCTAILQRHSKCRCKTSAPARHSAPPPVSPYPHFFSPFLLPGNSFAPRKYESVSWNDEGEFALNHIFYIVFLRSGGVLNIAR